MKLSIIIVNFNTQELLTACLQSLFQNYQRQLNNNRYEIIVVDNASTNGSIKTIKTEFPQVKFIQNSQNVGFTKANNQGINKAKGEYVLLLNPDTVVYKYTLTRLLRYFDKHGDTGIVTCKVILANGQIDDASHRGFPTPWRALTHFLGLARLLPNTQLFNGYHLGYKNLEKIHEIDACAGAFLLIPRSVGQKVGWLDEDYFWYGDDLDLCYRVKQAGYKIMYIPDVSILHYKGVASGLKSHSRYLSRADQKIRKLATQARFEVMRIFYQKHYLDKYPKWVTGIVFLGINLMEKFHQVTL